MDLLKEFFRYKTPARLLMIIAALLVFVSQYFMYFNDKDNSYMTIGPDFSSSRVYLDLSARPAATGWEAHPHAYVILVVLAFMLLIDDIADNIWFRRFGYWAAFILLFAATTPGVPFRAGGAKLGGIAVLMALAAALIHQFSKKTDPVSPDRV